MRRGFKMVLFNTRMCYFRFWELKKKFLDTKLSLLKFLSKSLYFKGSGGDRGNGNLEKAYYFLSTLPSLMSVSDCFGSFLSFCVSFCQYWLFIFVLVRFGPFWPVSFCFWQFRYLCYLFLLVDWICPKYDWILLNMTGIIFVQCPTYVSGTTRSPGLGFKGFLSL